MTTKHAIISGASIAGLSAAYWFDHIGWSVTVLERAKTFRNGGQNVDMRGVARDVLLKMGLFDEVKSHNTTEVGTVLIGQKGQVIAELPSGGSEGATAELEVLRGDLATIIRDHLPASIAIVYDQIIEKVDETATTVHVTTKSGTEYAGDLLVIAEGVRSSTRDLVLSDITEVCELGITMAFGTIPRTDRDTDYWRWYNTTRGRQVHLRPDNQGNIRAILSYTNDQAVTRHQDVAQILRNLHQTFEDAGWEAKRVLNGFDTTNDMYADDLAQVKMSQWYRGRTVAVGDAAWCVTPIGGGGASLALTGGYVLAAYLSQIQAGANGLERALHGYQLWMRPLVDKIQTLPPGMKPLAYPQTHVGLAVRATLNKILTSGLLRPVVAKMFEAGHFDKALPEMRTERPERSGYA